MKFLVILIFAWCGSCAHSHEGEICWRQYVSARLDAISIASDNSMDVESISHMIDLAKNGAEMHCLIEGRCCNQVNRAFDNLPYKEMP